MKLKDLHRALGFRRPPREYPLDVSDVFLPGYTIRFARWLHPGERHKTITQESVDALREFLRDGDVGQSIAPETRRPPGIARSVGSAATNP